MFPPGAEQTQAPNVNALAQVQQDEALLSLFHRHECVQENLIEAQARIAQQDAKAAMAVLPSDASSLAQMAVHAAPSTPKSPLVVGGAQPEGYLCVGLNHGLSVWGHADIVATSIVLDDEEGCAVTGRQET